MVKAKFYIAMPGGRTEGPFSMEELMERVKTGQLVPEYMCCPEGGRKWISIREILRFDRLRDGSLMGVVRKPRTYVTSAICVLVLAVVFPLFRIVSPLLLLLAVPCLIFSLMAGSAWNRGDVNLCLKRRGVARVFVVIINVLIFLWLAFILLLWGMR